MNRSSERSSRQTPYLITPVSGMYGPAGTAQSGNPSPPGLVLIYCSYCGRMSPHSASDSLFTAGSSSALFNQVARSAMLGLRGIALAR